MTPQALKASILQRAIQGKLVPQLPEEGTAEELYQQIQAEKQRLIANGTIKREKALSPIKEDEIPFDIPETWKWVRLGDCISLQSGQDLQPQQYNNLQKGIPYITGASNIDEYRVIINRWTEAPKSYAFKGDLLISCKGTIGKMAILTEEKVHIARQIMGIKPIMTSTQYIQFFLEQKIPTFKQDAKSFIPGIERSTILATLIPLPPLEEQKRIVAKIEEMLPLVERYGEAYTELETFNMRFPDDLRKSILQEAIQGKLVPQLPEEGSAEELYQQIQAEKQTLIANGTIKKEKPLPPIKEKDLPFNIPETWKWVRWGEIVNVVSARRVHQSDWKTSGVPFYRAREIAALAEKDSIQNELYISDELYHKLSESGIPRQGDVMVTAVGTLGKAYIVKDRDRFYYKDASVICLENIGQIEPKYIKYTLDSEMMKAQIKANSSGTTVGTLTIVRMNAYLIPLPPLAEQKRIVAKIEEMLALCKKHAVTACVISAPAAHKT